MSDNRFSAYRDFQRSIPGLADMYRLVQALVAKRAGSQGCVLIVGAGGGREIEELAKAGFVPAITAVDPSKVNLNFAKRVAERNGITEKVELVHGTLADIDRNRRFDVVTSLLVMHHIPDDGAKQSFLRNVKENLALGGLHIHCDYSIDGGKEFYRLSNIYAAHCTSLGLPKELLQREMNALKELAIVGPSRIHELFISAGLQQPQEIFRSLWYRCWVSEINQRND